jgi:hypothetical protein
MNLKDGCKFLVSVYGTMFVWFLVVYPILAAIFGDNIGGLISMLLIWIPLFIPTHFQEKYSILHGPIAWISWFFYYCFEIVYADIQNKPFGHIKFRE